MKKKSIFKFLSTLLLSSAIVVSCVDPQIDLANVDTDVKIDAALIVPVGELNFTLNDLIKEVGTNEYLDTTGNQISLISESSVEYPFREVNMMEFSKSTDAPLFPASVVSSLIPSLILPARYVIPSIETTDSISLGLNGTDRRDSERIISAEIKKATIGFTISLSPDINGSNPANGTIKESDLSIIIEFPNKKVHKSNGDDIVLKFVPVKYGQLIPQELIDFHMETSGNASGIPVKVTINAKVGDKIMTITNSSKISCKMSFNQIDYSIIRGYFKPSTKATNSNSVPIDLPDFFNSLNLKFYDPQATVSIENYVGLALRFNVDYVRALDKNNNIIAKANFTGPDSYNGGEGKIFDLTRPTVEYGFSKGTIILNRDNGATNRLFETGKVPKSLDYKFSAGVNPNDNNLSYLTPDAKIKAKVNIKFPLHFDSGTTFEMKDSIADFGKMLDSINSVKALNAEIALVLTITNGFPLSTSFEIVSPIDSKGVPILTDWTKIYPIESAIVETDITKSNVGQVKTPTTQTINLNINSSQFEEMKKMKNLVFKIKIGGQQLANNTWAPILLTKKDSFGVKVGVYGKGNAILGVFNK